MRVRAGMLLMLALVVGFRGGPGPGEARVPLLPESRVWVDGTSNKSDWTVQAGTVRGHVTLRLEGEALEVSEGGFTVAAGSLRSEHGVIMDRLMHNALRTGEHPEIVYELIAVQATPESPGRYTLGTRGRLTLAGVTKEIEQTVVAERGSDGRVRFTGSHPIDMPEWGITPPTAMFGSLRTGRRVIVHFELLAKP